MKTTHEILQEHETRLDQGGGGSGEIDVKGLISQGLDKTDDNRIKIKTGIGIIFDDDNAIKVDIGDGLTYNESNVIESVEATESEMGIVLLGTDTGTVTTSNKVHKKLQVGDVLHNNTVFTWGLTGDVFKYTGSTKIIQNGYDPIVDDQAEEIALITDIDDKLSLTQGDSISKPVVGKVYQVGNAIYLDGTIYIATQINTFSYPVDFNNWSKSIESSFYYRIDQNLSTPIVVNNNIEISLIHSLLNPTVLQSNGLNKNFTIDYTNRNIKFPDFYSTKNYMISLRINGQFQGSSGTLRTLTFGLGYGTGGAFVKSIIRTESINLPALTTSINTYTTGSSDRFQTEGIKLFLMNTGGVVLNITSFSIIIQGY
ncbi:MAG: hypothetical protein ACRC31_03135 [Cetobacterium sp.]